MGRCLPRGEGACPPDWGLLPRQWGLSAHGAGALELGREAGHLQDRAPAAGFPSRALKTQWAGRRQSGVRLALQRSRDPVPHALPPKQLPRFWGV